MSALITIGNFDSLTILSFNEGGKNMIAMQDINNDQKPDLLIGNYSGGLSFFSSDSSVINNQINSNPQEFESYPNPTSRFLTIENNIIGKLTITNAIGKIVLIENKKTKKITLDLKNIDSGLYLININSYTSKIIVQ